MITFGRCRRYEGVHGKLENIRDWWHGHRRTAESSRPRAAVMSRSKAAVVRKLPPHPQDLLRRRLAAPHRVVHVEVLPLAEAADVPDAVLAQPGADDPDVLRVVQVVDDVGGQDLLGVDQARCGRPACRIFASFRASMVRSTAVSRSSGRHCEKATSVAIELLPGGTVSGLKVAGKDRRWNGNGLFVEVDPVLVRDVRPVDPEIDAVDPLVLEGRAGALHLRRDAGEEARDERQRQREEQVVEGDDRAVGEDDLLLPAARCARPGAAGGRCCSRCAQRARQRLDGAAASDTRRRRSPPPGPRRRRGRRR